MAVAGVQFFSQAMGRQVNYSIILPDRSPGPYPVLLQLHGLGDDQNSWIHRSGITRYVEELGIAVVFPDGASSGYLNWRASGRLSVQRYEDLIMTDISDHVRRHFNVADGKWAIGGLSMGGYGAMRLGLKYADRFASIWSHSSAFRIDNRAETSLLDEDGLDDANIYRHVERIRQSGADFPVITFDCGVDDELIQENRDLHEFLDGLGVEHQYFEHPGGHTWEYWDEHVQEALVQHARVLGL